MRRRTPPHSTGCRSPVTRFSIAATWRRAPSASTSVSAAKVLEMRRVGRVRVPYFCELPVVGQVLFQQPALTYAAFFLTIPIHLFLMKTRAGLALRAVGENPAAAFSVGTDPIRVRVAAIVACGALAGLGGAVLSLQELGTFTDGMTHGRGFIALAAIILFIIRQRKY